MYYFVSILVLQSHAIVPVKRDRLKRNRNLVALLLLSCRCIVTVNVPWLFLTVPWVGLQCVIVVFTDHAHLLFSAKS